MHKLWGDQVTWMRLYIVSFTANLPDTDLAAQRLLRNASDIGNATRPRYGDAAADELSALLRQHILGMFGLLTAARSGNTTAFNKARRTWYANGARIAAFLHTANPRNWPLLQMEKMMRRHLDLTMEEAVARLQGRHAADIAAYDRAHDQILRLADVLTEGIIAQSPQP
jgi:hypothetical protein